MRDRVALFRDHALDERLVGVQRVVEHDNVAAAGLADAIDELVHDEPVLVFERRRHALALDARDLDAERDDEDGVDGGRGQRLHPGQQFFLDLRQLRARALRGHLLQLGVGRGQSFKYSLSRRVCVRLTGISVAFSSFILRM